ncbi:Coenzyme F420 hydrogenase/dehydrogenase, beta subunit C-terminal domain [Butyrivibrio sp. VCB2006]|uniref:Coenzyme F420 hydrogenase/dehydrogenase, beta subunit C-terminal domain n=1 Tax=Butyrivibrio sp. VCB2006 TaxID=1280679 RepID=UPI00042278F8|nr:Coenzyme F420 hydrogenase/dehydrogenase, beta subunit C-terminal domain [Butyrivibrio sp. VCB2006]
MKKDHFITIKRDCCGCSACQQICPQNCITMDYDKEGFLYPVIDKSKCINCNLCKKTCPVLHNVNKDDAYLNSYIAISNKPNRIASSSGGLFFLFAEKIIGEGGAVFGAAFDDNWQVHHICIESMDEIDTLMRSKYVQSSTNNTYRQVRKLLGAGRKVLYTGTPCQIAGLKSFLKKIYNNLITVDILCHGVPSPMIWKYYLSNLEREYHSAPKEVNFRDKVSGWKDYSLSVNFLNGKRYVKTIMSDDYMRMFLTNYNLRPSCYDCRFRGLNRDCDITIGDAWGINTVKPEFDDDKGTSIIIIHSENGKKLIDEISKDCTMEKINVDDLIPPDKGVRTTIKMPEQRALLFYHWIHGKDFDKMNRSMYGGRKNYILGKIFRTIYRQ